jgi:hypothetical protein
MKSLENVWITMLWMEEILHLGWLKAQHNNGMFTTIFNRCRISQPSTVLPLTIYQTTTIVVIYITHNYH